MKRPTPPRGVLTFAYWSWQTSPVSQCRLLLACLQTYWHWLPVTSVFEKWSRLEFGNLLIPEPLSSQKWRRSRIEYIPKCHVILFVRMHPECKCIFNSTSATFSLHLFLLKFTQTFTFISGFDTLTRVWVFVSEQCVHFSCCVAANQRRCSGLYRFDVGCGSMSTCEAKRNVSEIPFYSSVGARGRLKTRHVIGRSVRLPQWTNHIFFPR